MLVIFWVDLPMSVHLPFVESGIELERNKLEEWNWAEIFLLCAVWGKWAKSFHGHRSNGPKPWKIRTFIKLSMVDIKDTTQTNITFLLVFNSKFQGQMTRLFGFFKTPTHRNFKKHTSVTEVLLTSRKLSIKILFVTKYSNSFIESSFFIQY